MRAALVHLAKELHTWGPKLDAATSASTSTDAGAGPAMNTISAIYDAALNDARRVGELISVADKSERRTLSPEVEQVQGQGEDPAGGEHHPQGFPPPDTLPPVGPVTEPEPAAQRLGERVHAPGPVTDAGDLQRQE